MPPIWSDLGDILINEISIYDYEYNSYIQNLFWKYYFKLIDYYVFMPRLFLGIVLLNHYRVRLIGTCKILRD